MKGCLLAERTNERRFVYSYISLAVWILLVVEEERIYSLSYLFRKYNIAVFASCVLLFTLVSPLVIS